MAIAVALIIVIMIIVVLVIGIIILLKRRKRESRSGKLPDEKQRTYDTIEMRDIPHITPNGSSQIYALSFKDKKTKTLHNDTEEGCVTGRNANGLSASCEFLNLPPSASHDQIYAEPDVVVRTGQETWKGIAKQRATCLSTPLLDVNEYEPVSVPNIDSKQKSKTLSTLSVSSNLSNSGGRRWTSQRLKKDAPWTPPMTRHASSFRKPAAVNPSISSEYTQMTIEDHAASSPQANHSSPKKTPVYAKADKKRTKDKQSHKDTRTSRTSEIADDGTHHYADIEKAGARPQDRDDDELIDTYLSNLPGPFTSVLPDHMMHNKSVSLQRSPSSRPAPPKPQRGKCQSEFLGNEAYSVVSDYEIMSTQVKDENTDDHDYDKCNVGEPFLPSNEYDRPKKIGRNAHTLPRIGEGMFEETTQNEYGHRDGRRVKSLDESNYEYVGGDDEGRIKDSAEALKSPQYADIRDNMYASVDDHDVCASEWQDEDNDYSDFD